MLWALEELSLYNKQKYFATDFPPKADAFGTQIGFNMSMIFMDIRQNLICENFLTRE